MIAFTGLCIVGGCAIIWQFIRCWTGKASQDELERWEIYSFWGGM